MFKKKKDKETILGGIINSSEEEFRECFNTGDYKVVIEREGDITTLNSSRGLMIGDLIEILTNIIMISPPQARKDLIAIVTKIAKVLQDKEERLLH